MRAISIFLAVTVVVMALGCGDDDDGAAGVGGMGGSDASTGIDAGSEGAGTGDGGGGGGGASGLGGFGGSGRSGGNLDGTGGDAGLDRGTGGSGSTGGNGGTGGGADDGGTGGAGGTGGDSTTGDGGLACQLDIYVLLNDSGSMVAYWPSVAEAFNTFLHDPESAGVGMGIQYFGPDSPCDAEMYASPAAPIAPLPENAVRIGDSFPMLPVRSTPTQPALEGAIRYARSWSVSHPGSKVVVWLITDDVPHDCSSTIENVAETARNGLNGTPSILTYVIGIGNVEELHRIADAGGTGTAILADPISSQSIVQVMDGIRDSARDCN
jgi:hypothetical protein